MMSYSDHKVSKRWRRNRGLCDHITVAEANLLRNLARYCVCSMCDKHYVAKNAPRSDITRTFCSQQCSSRAHNITSDSFSPAVDLAWWKASKPDVCEVCGEDGGKKNLAIDHQHSTGKVRGFLCHGCNVAAGLLGDSPKRLRLLIAYLEERGCDGE